MAELTNYKDAASNRHLRFKLQSLSRRLDELEEATKNLQRAEDELLDLQDKVIQAEGSDSSTLAEIEVLRQRVLKIEGKDEEIKRAEDLCHTMKEKLEEEENLTRELKSEIERLQKRMVDLEKNSHVPPAETIRWKSHSASSDSRHITVRNAWKSKRDLKCSEDPPTGIGRNMEATNAYTQRPCTDFLELEQPRSQPSEQGARRVGNSGDAPELSPRRTQSSLTASEVLTRRDRMGGAITAASCNHSSSMNWDSGTTIRARRPALALAEVKLKYTELRCADMQRTH